MDYWAVLFCPLVVQAMSDFEPRIGYLFSGIFTAITTYLLLSGLGSEVGLPLTILYGSAYFVRSVSDEEVPMVQVDVPLLAPGESHTETVEIKRTLPETEPDEEYQVIVELRDDDDELVKKATWENT